MALAPVVYCLWQRFLRFDPTHPIWPNRDRFVLSAGHASMLVYAMLHLTGVKAVNPSTNLGHLSVTLEDIKRSGSSTANAPATRNTAGLQDRDDHGSIRTGGGDERRYGHRRALVRKLLQPPGLDLFDCDIYALCGDGCMMEGISGEAASLAGHLKLANLCWIYDNNHITIEGNTALAYSDDVATRSSATAGTYAGRRRQRLGDARARIQNVQNTIDRR